MRIVVGHRKISLAIFPVIAFYLIAVLPNELGQTLLNGPPDPKISFIEAPKKIISLLALGLTIVCFKKLSPFLRKVFLWTMAFVLFLCLESFYRYGNFFTYPHVFGKLFVLFSCTAIYIFFRGAKEWVFTVSLFSIAVVFLADILIYYPTVFTLNSFMNVERGLHAGCVSLLMSVWIYTFNTYLIQKKPWWLIAFFTFTACILFLNHRTVWLSSTSALVLSLIVNQAKGKEKYPAAVFTPLLMIPGLAVMLIFAYVFSEKPEILKFISQRISDITNIEDQGTGSWRLEQWLSYWPYIKEHPWFGMRFEGYELPVQFFAQQNGKQVFEQNTGHHFHSFYVDNVFYVGVVGMVILGAVFIYPLYRVMTLPIKMPLRLVALSCWTLVALQYGLSYPIDDFHFAIAGFTMAGIDTYLDKVDMENREEFKQDERLARRAERERVRELALMENVG